MGLFDSSLIEKEVHISLAENLLIDLCGEIEILHKDLISAMSSHGMDSVAACIEMIINRLKSSEKYKNLDVTSAKYDSDFKKYKFVSVIKNNLYVVIKTGSLYHFYNPEDMAVAEPEDRGDIFVTLDKYLRITKRKFKPYERLW